jgi:hypothetical protein
MAWVVSAEISQELRPFFSDSIARHSFSCASRVQDDNVRGGTGEPFALKRNRRSGDKLRYEIRTSGGSATLCCIRNLHVTCGLRRIYFFGARSLGFSTCDSFDREFWSGAIRANRDIECFPCESGLLRVAGVSNHREWGVVYSEHRE